MAEHIVEKDARIEHVPIPLERIMIHPGVQVFMIDRGDVFAAATEIIVSTGARLTLIQEQRSDSIKTVRIVAQPIAQVQLVGYWSSGTITLELILHEHARVDVKGLCHVTTTQRVQITTRQHHTQPHAYSTVLIKSIVYDQARTDYRGTIVVDAAAQHTQANQQTPAILMSPHARTTSMPQLEIEAHQVQCKHGSAAGRLDPVHMAYLISRGVEHARAQELLVHAFAADILLSVPEPEIMCTWKAFLQPQRPLP